MIKRINTDKLQRFCELNKLGIKDQEYFKLREELMVLYMPMARRIVEGQNIKNIDIDDLYQMAYEALILTIDKLTDYRQLYVHLKQKIYVQIKKYMNDYKQTNIPISEVEIQSNLNMEEHVVNEIVTEYLTKKVLAVCSNKRNVEILKRYAIKKITYTELAKEFNLSKERVRRICYQLPVRIKGALIKKNKYISIIRLYNDYNFNDECDTIENSHTYTKK